MVNKRILGMPVALFVIGLLVMGTATAALVAFLSNEVTATASVDSPLELRVWDGGWENNIVLPQAFGGGEVMLTLREQNFASHEINSDLTITITEAASNVCEEVTIEFRQKDSGHSWKEISCDVTPGGNLKYVYNTDVPAGHDQQYEVRLTFAQAAYGDYSATIRHMDP